MDSKRLVEIAIGTSPATPGEARQLANELIFCRETLRGAYYHATVIVSDIRRHLAVSPVAPVDVTKT